MAAFSKVGTVCRVQLSRVAAAALRAGIVRVGSGELGEVRAAHELLVEILGLGPGLFLLGGAGRGLGDHLGLDVLLDGELIAGLLAQQRLGQPRLLERQTSSLGNCFLRIGRGAYPLVRDRPG
jgi:hypothetical protein